MPEYVVNSKLRRGLYRVHDTRCQWVYLMDEPNQLGAFDSLMEAERFSWSSYTPSASCVHCQQERFLPPDAD